MIFLRKAIPLYLFIFFSHQLYAQLAVKSDFKRDEGRLNIELINKSPYILFFMTEHLLDPPYISIESFDSEDNSIEWLQYPPLGHGGPYLFDSMYLYLGRNESYPLSFNIKPDKKKRKPKYFIVDYSLPFRRLDIKKIESSLFQQFKNSVGVEKLRFTERFEFETGNGANGPACD